MIYRIDFQHFLTHAIDYFTREELLHFQYSIVSAKVRNLQKRMNVVKMNPLYPDVDIVTDFHNTGNREVMERRYMADLMPKSKEEDYTSNLLYLTYVNPLVHHVDVVIICDRDENPFVDVICKVLKKKFKIEVIDLNELFTKGRVGSIYIDLKEIKNASVSVKREAAMESYRTTIATEDGRYKIMQNMSKKDKIKQLKSIGIEPSTDDIKEIDALLMDAWVKDNDDDN